MPVITYVEHDGVEHHVDLKVGTNLMRGAIHNGVPGISGDCGGCCACGTCHIILDPSWSALVGERSEMEAGILEIVVGAGDRSRLACQIEVTADLAGMVVHLPDALAQ